MPNEEEIELKFKQGDRVVQAGQSGPEGTVLKVRIETTRLTLKDSNDDVEPPGVTVTVLWDNGTSSHFVPDGLDSVN